jgi:cell division transport system permease protein
VREDVSVEVFFPPDASQQEIDKVRSAVEGYPEVSSVNYVSKEEALETFKETFADQPEIYEGIDPGVLPASLQVQLENPAAADEVAQRLREDHRFTDDNLSYPQQTIERLNKVTSYMILGLYGATALFLISSVLLISNAIRLSIFARRKEIEVMKLVGASDSFVRTPFVFEGMVQSLIGAGLAALTVVWINFLFVDWSQDALPFVPISGDAVNTLLILAVLVVVGVVIGVIGSFLSVTRFLRKI